MEVLNLCDHRSKLLADYQTMNLMIIGFPYTGLSVVTIWFSPKETKSQVISSYSDAKKYHKSRAFVVQTQSVERKIKSLPTISSLFFYVVVHHIPVVL